ncbi:MAG: hypothetical protein JW996_03340, partial [Candidatus Cloacimonetes bacterium]|nr:hypothetical protein [Candidatus Cloacimonadota bacterium]
LSAEMKAFQCIDDNSIKAAIGLSSLFYDKFILRLGYKFNHDAEDLSAGVGFKIGKFSLDYAYLPFDYEIDDVHIIGINYLF